MQTSLGCTCEFLDDDLIEWGWTCHHCYEYHKDNKCDCED